MIYNPNGVGEIEVDTIILDLNGTLAVNGSIVKGAKERLGKLKELGYKIFLLTGNQRGNAGELCHELGIDFKVAKTSDEKEAITKEFINSSKGVVSIGNARIDIGTFKDAKVRIGTLQAEGIHTGIIEYIDILVPSLINALDLLIDEDTFNATMRK